MSTPGAVVQKLWNYCNIRRDEQLIFLPFVEMADEQAPPFNKPPAMPKDHNWPSRLSVRDLKVVMSANLRRATRLRQTILHHAFTGRFVASTRRKNL